MATKHNTNSTLTQQQVQANEKFFRSILALLNDNGVYCYPAIQANFVKRNNKLCSDNAKHLSSVAAIVSHSFFVQHFELLTQQA